MSVELNSHGVNKLIKATILSDEKMREIGFTDYAKDRWYFCRLIKFQNKKGCIFVSDAALSNITGAAATSCFGVKGMAYRSKTDGFVHLLRREAMDKGVRITQLGDNEISIELHMLSTA